MYLYIIKQIEIMTTELFINKTSLNGRFQIFSMVEIPGLKNYGPNNILEYKNEIYKNLNNYWVDKNQLETIRNNYQTETCYF